MPSEPATSAEARGGPAGGELGLGCWGWVEGIDRDVVGAQQSGARRGGAEGRFQRGVGGGALGWGVTARGGAWHGGGGGATAGLGRGGTKGAGLLRGA